MIQFLPYFISVLFCLLHEGGLLSGRFLLEADLGQGVCAGVLHHGGLDDHHPLQLHRKNEFFEFSILPNHRDRRCCFDDRGGGLGVRYLMQLDF